MATQAPPGVGLTTEVDRELKGLTDKVQDGSIGTRSSGRTGELNGDTELQDEPPSAWPEAIPWEFFQIRHHEWMGEFWEQCRAFYAGGPRLLNNDRLMMRVFPPHNNEHVAIYASRKDKAFYFTYAGTIIDNLLGGLLEDPVTVSPVETGDPEKDDVATLDEEMNEFLQNVASPTAERMSVHTLLHEIVREALTTRCAWTLIDLPRAPEELKGLIQDRKTQEDAGLLRAYAVPVEAEFVINWCDDEEGMLEWATICNSELRQDFINTQPYIRKTFTTYTRTGWARYRIQYPPDKPPKKDDPVALVDEGEHNFGKVPLVRTKLPEGLWAMGKLESLAREHFNKRCAVAWAEYKSLFSILYEFLAPEEGTMMQPVVSDAQRDPNRAINQVRGQGWTQTRGEKDRAEFVGPPTAPFTEGRESCNDIMREMHRVLFSMSMSANMDRAALQRSGESKQSDDAKITVLLKALGRHAREALKNILELWSTAKGGERKFDDLGVVIGGADEFSAADVMRAIEQAVQFFNGIPLKSVTLMRAALLKIYKTYMGEELTAEEWAQVRKEIAEQITSEGMMLDDPAMVAMRELIEEQDAKEQGTVNLPDPDDGEDDDEEDDDDEPEPRPPRPRARPRTLISR